MKRDFKFSSVLILQLILAVIVLIINQLLAGSPAGLDDISNSNAGLLSRILTFLTVSIFQFMIAYGLVHKRMGSVGEYMDGINHLNIKIIVVLFLIDIIPGILLFLTAFGVSAASSSNFVANGNFEAVLTIVGLGFLMLIAWTIYGVFVHYRYLLAADRKDLSFAGLFKETFSLGKALFAKTIKVYFKRLVLPIMVFIALFAIIANFLNSSLGLVFILILPIVLAIYIIIANTLLLGELSALYLDYKNKEVKL